MPASPAPDDQRLRKSERLKGRKAFEALFQQGEKLFKGGFQLQYRLLDSAEARQHPKASPLRPVRVGLVASKRKFRKAHQRNRVKRLMREVYRQRKGRLYACLPEEKQLHLLLICHHKRLPTYAQVEDNLGAALQELEKALRNPIHTEETSG